MVYKTSANNETWLTQAQRDFQLINRWIAIPYLSHSFVVCSKCDVRLSFIVSWIPLVFFAVGQSKQATGRHCLGQLWMNVFTIKAFFTFYGIMTDKSAIFSICSYSRALERTTSSCWFCFRPLNRHKQPYLNCSVIQVGIMSCLLTWRNMFLVGMIKNGKNHLPK